jgi:hypothetical protein
VGLLAHEGPHEFLVPASANATLIESLAQ